MHLICSYIGVSKIIDEFKKFACYMLLTHHQVFTWSHNIDGVLHFVFYERFLAPMIISFRLCHVRMHLYIFFYLILCFGRNISLFFTFFFLFWSPLLYGFFFIIQFACKNYFHTLSVEKKCQLRFIHRPLPIFSYKEL